MDADALLAARLQEEEREQFSIDEQARFLVEMETIAERKRFFAAQRAEQIRNKPPTKTQLRNKMITFLKNIKQDVVDLYRLVKERYETISPEGYDINTLGDLITLLQSSEEDVKMKGSTGLPMIMLEVIFDEDFDDIDDMVNEAMDNVEGDTINVGGAVNSATTRVSAPSASVTTGGVSISTAEPRTTSTILQLQFEEDGSTIAQTLVKIEKIRWIRKKEMSFFQSSHNKNLLTNNNSYNI
ncbi:hypothetical protein Tco_0823939 [Tanacetum coccineum]|uniref:Uncharacterized protein n=1 Tax=Tanacetum coccineum TaxID=301880 RepID=A0ABQ5AJC4_9ASTR